MFSNLSRSAGAAHGREIVSIRHSMIGAALFAICVIPGLALAQGANLEDRFPQVSASPDAFATSFVPASVSGRLVRVVVIMSGDSVAAVRAKMPMQKMAAVHADTIQRQALEQQAAIKPMLELHGAKVLAQYQHALNGIKVEVDSSKIAALAKLPGVVSVAPVGIYNRANAVAVPFIGAPAVWQGIPGFRGEGIKIAVIDTGIDYTHANFGGPGTVAAFNTAFANSTAPADPTMFGPGAPKVKGGTDLVGDAYNADDPANNTPHPDPNPLDCAFTSGNVGHGSHTAGTAAGFGVLNNATYGGPYNSAAYQQHFQIGPGVAPKADIYAVRVFGCAGSSNVVTEAIDWAVANNMDVISMSLGSDFGDANTSEAIAVHNAVLAGITVVSASGNAGPAPYITSTPASGTGGITAAAMDGTAAFPGARLALTGNPNPILVQNSNGASFTNGTQYPIVVLRNPDGTVSLGCNPAEYDPTQGGVNVTGKLVVTVRGSCARVFRAGAAQHFGAAAAAMIDTSASSYPPFEGPIPGGAANPNLGNIYEPVTIPFFGVLRSDTTALTGPTGGPAPATATATNATVTNPGFETVASFSSGGPRYGDSFFQPSLAAPGVSVFSTASGTGTGGQFLSGTSMATPMISGVAALVRQAHPGWSELAQRAAVTQTGDRFQMVGYSARLAGTGVVQPLPAVQTQAVVLGTANAPEPLSLGFVELTTLNYSAIKNIDIRNNGATPITFKVNVTPAGGVPHLVAPMTPTVTVPGSSDALLPIKISVPVGTIGPADLADTINGYKDVAGTVTLTPTDLSTNGGASLNVPYYLVPRARSLIQVSHNAPSLSNPNTTLTVSNGPASIAGTADFYAWGLSGTPQGIPYADTRAVGVQSFPSGNNATLVFAINTFNRFSNAAANEWDIAIDTNGDGNPDYFVIGANISALVAGQASGRLASAVCRVTNPVTLACTITAVRFFADAPTDGTTILLPVIASDLGLSPTNPRFSYQAFASSVDGGVQQVGGTAKFNAFTPAISTGQFVSVAPNGTATVPVSINTAEWAITPALGVMAVAIENLNGTPQADLIPISP
jgi:minor extracellular serine protease Vpr